MRIVAHGNHGIADSQNHLARFILVDVYAAARQHTGCVLRPTRSGAGRRASIQLRASSPLAPISRCLPVQALARTRRHHIQPQQKQSPRSHAATNTHTFNNKNSHPSRTIGSKDNPAMPTSQQCRRRRDAFPMAPRRRRHHTPSRAPPLHRRRARRGDRLLDPAQTRIEMFPRSHRHHIPSSSIKDLIISSPSSCRASSSYASEDPAVKVLDNIASPFAVVGRVDRETRSAYAPGHARSRTVCSNGQEEECSFPVVSYP